MELGQRSGSALLAIVGDERSLENQRLLRERVSPARRVKRITRYASRQVVHASLLSCAEEALWGYPERVGL